MLSFFRINDPFRLIGILGIIVIFGSIYIWGLGIPLLQPELVWLLLGEKLSSGAQMYINVIDDTGPLAAGTYWVINLIFGKSLLAYKIFAAIIVLFQVTYVSNLFIKYKSFEENTYIPALVMVILFFTSFDFLTLSPALMGSTFIVLALAQLFAQTVLQKEGSDAVLLVGIFGGIAACFHFPLITFLPFLLVSGIIVSGFSFRQLIVSLIAYSMPFVFCSVYYFWIGGLEAFLYQFIVAPRLIESYVHVDYRDLALLFAPALFFVVIGFFVGLVFSSQTVNQQKQLQLNLIFSIFAVSSIFLTNRRTPYQFIVLLPAMAYFISMLFVKFKKGYIIKILTVLFVLGLPLFGIFWTYTFVHSPDILAYGVIHKEKHQIADGKKTLVLGEDIAYYKNASLATPFLHYRLSKQVLTDHENIESTLKIYREFELDKPEIIVDEEAIFEKLLKRIPALAKEYDKQGEYYFIKKSN